MGSCMSSFSAQRRGPRGRKHGRAKRRRNDLHCDTRGRRARGRTTAMGEDELQNVPGRMWLNGASDVASLFTQQGRKGTNQDAMLVWENFASRDDTVFCGVFDGHGPFGHMVAKKVRDSLPVQICHQWKVLSSDEHDAIQNDSPGVGANFQETASSNLDEDWMESLDNNEGQKLPEMYATLRQALLKAFRLTDKELNMHPTIDCFCSGSTAVTLLKQGQDLVIANVGDSRAILGTRDKDNSLVAVQLTVDLKPNLPNEAARIQQCSGRVFALQDEPEVARVWLPNSDSPGLAMARAFGDFCLKDYGLISVPDISYHCLTDRDEFIVLATDGIWDVLSNKEVVDVVAFAPTRGTAARALVDSAVRAWRLKFPTSKIDDCAAVCLFLHPSSPSDQENELSTPKTSTDNISLTVLGLDNEGESDVGDGHQPQSGSSLLVSSPGHQACTPIMLTEEIVPLEIPNAVGLHDISPSTRSLADCISTAEEEEWSALEGVTRVNSLLNLPRFLSGDKRSYQKKRSSKA